MSIILLVGASGSGKSTIGKKLEKEGITQLVSFTTRPMRDGEVEGVDYYFVDKKDVFGKELAEFSYYNGNYYGLFKEEIENKLKEFQDVYFITDKHGAKQLVDKYPKDVYYFWLSITLEEMVNRMRNRGDNEQQVLSRIEHAIDCKEYMKPDNVGFYIKTLNANCATEHLVDSIVVPMMVKKGWFSKTFFETNIEANWGKANV